MYTCGAKAKTVFFFSFQKKYTCKLNIHLPTSNGFDDNKTSWNGCFLLPDKQKQMKMVVNAIWEIFYPPDISTGRLLLCSMHFLVFHFFTFLGNLKIAGMLSFILMGTAMHNSLCFHANSFSWSGFSCMVYIFFTLFFNLLLRFFYKPRKLYGGALFYYWF